MSDHKPIVSNQFLYSKIGSTLPSSSSEKVFTPTNATLFDYRGTQELVFRVAVAEANSFADFRHSYLRFDVKNTNAYPIYYDNLSTSLINRFQITCGGVSMMDDRDYNIRVQAMLDHWGSNELNSELAILSGHNYAPLVNGGYDLTASGTVNYGTNMIGAGETRTIAIPIISDFLTQKLVPLCLMGSSYLELHFFLEDPRRAFLIKGTGTNGTAAANNVAMVLGTRTITEADANNISYQITKGEVITNVISVKDNSFVASLAQTMTTQGIHISGKVWTSYMNVIPAGRDATVTFTIPDKSASMTSIVHAMTLSQPSPYMSNIQPAVFGSTGFEMTIGADKFPRKPVEYNTNSNNSFIAPYLALQKVSSHGFFNTENHTSVDYGSFTRQNPNNLYDFGCGYSNGVNKNKTIVDEHAVPIVVRPSNFVQALSLASFDNVSAVAETGISTRALNLPLQWTVFRDTKTYREANTALLDSTPTTDAVNANPEIPMLNSYCFVCSDVIWSLDSSGQWKVDK